MTKRVAEVSLDAISANVRYLKSLNPDSAFLAVVKAGGYGLGVTQAATAAIAGGADWLGTFDLAEAFKIRATLPEPPILAWGLSESDDFALALSQNITLALSDLRHLELLEKALLATSGSRASVHLKMDSGLSRNGFDATSRTTAFQEAARMERAGILKVQGIFTHLSNTSVDENEAQVQVFQQIVEEAKAAGLKPEFLHVAASETILMPLSAKFNMVRSGIAIYGYSPITASSSHAFGLKTALKLTAELLGTREVKAGAGVSYGFRFRAKEDTRLGLVGCGYADGLPRIRRPEKLWVSIVGKRYPVVGTVAMDQFVVELGTDSPAIGSEVIIYGDPERGEPSLEDWAIEADTINYELLTRLGSRVERKYV